MEPSKSNATSHWDAFTQALIAWSFGKEVFLCVFILSYERSVFHCKTCCGKKVSSGGPEGPDLMIEYTDKLKLKSSKIPKNIKYLCNMKSMRWYPLALPVATRQVRSLLQAEQRSTGAITKQTCAATSNDSGAKWARSSRIKHEHWNTKSTCVYVLVTSTWSLGHLKPTGLPNTFLFSRISAGAMLCPVPKFFQCFQPSNEAYWGKAGRSTELTKTFRMAKGTKSIGKSWDGSRTNEEFKRRGQIFGPTIDYRYTIDTIHNTLLYLYTLQSPPSGITCLGPAKRSRRNIARDHIRFDSHLMCNMQPARHKHIWSQSGCPPIYLYLVSFCPFMASMYTYIIHNPWRYVVWNLESWV